METEEKNIQIYKSIKGNILFFMTVLILRYSAYRKALLAG